MVSISQELAAIQERLHSEIARKRLEIDAISTTIGIVSREEAAQVGKIAVTATRETPGNESRGSGWAEKIPPVELKEALAGSKPRW